MGLGCYRREIGSVPLVWRVRPLSHWVKEAWNVDRILYFMPFLQDVLYELHSDWGQVHSYFLGACPDEYGDLQV